MIQKDQQPLVSCIMPTYNRREFIPYAIKYFLRQDYENKELIIMDDGSDAIEDLVPDAPGIRYFRLEQKITLGAKLNMACLHAQGNIIAHWDDDDWYADWRLKYQVESLLANQTGVCGINKLLYYDLRSRNAFQYIYPADQRTWLIGSSLCYTRQLWSGNKFADINVGMDGLFVWNTSPGNITVLENHRFAVHMIHNNNISPKQTNGAWWHAYPVEEIQKVMGDDWFLYGGNGHAPGPELNQYKLGNGIKLQERKPLKNIYACLVHESQECIKDLVCNLHYNDPASVILLYNGSMNPNLIPADFSFSAFGAVLHPKPTPVKHGYLHNFALDSMEFALENFDFDCFTIVDSDQLSIRPGYPAYLEKHLSAASNVGMLSSKPERVDRYNKTNHVALQAFREYDLWKPLLSKFAEGEDKFVHWTFWPSTVFMADAARDLVKIFREDVLLQQIMQRSGIWATEEVILPTLVRLLGYEIHANPCSYDFVRYQLPVCLEELGGAMSRKDAYWVHPIARNFNEPVRKLVREQLGHYQVEHGVQPEQKNLPADSVQALPILNKIRKIEGWLSSAEAELLIAITVKACRSLNPPYTIVEVGSYHGKATVLFGSVVKENFPEARIVAIDPHDGKLGAADQGLQTFPPSLDMFKRNIANAAIAEVVEIVQDHCRNVEWHAPVSLLFIDGLHDYINVSRDFRHFSDSIRTGGYIAFHDYADYFPGVKVFVNELLETGLFRKINVVDSLIVLQKL
jgi:glycosyltransferase involved in cell wall biosynthesis